MLTVLGLTQSFGIFQRHYAEQAAVKDGIIHPSETSQRAAIATIGALGNGGIMSVFGVLWCPHLPLFGKHIKKICALGTLLMAMGFGIAAASSHVSSSFSYISFTRILNDLAVASHPFARVVGRYWRRSLTLVAPSDTC
jgi:hypothetical protein